MPLIQGASIESCKKNYSMLLKEGYNKQQAYAIMSNTCRRNMRKVSRQRQIEIRQGKFFGAK